MVTAMLLVILVLLVVAFVAGIIAFLAGAAISFVPIMFKLGMIVVPAAFIIALLANIF